MKMKKTTAKTTTPTNQLRDRCHSHFLTLRIPVEPAALDELLARAEKESLTHLRFLDLLLGTQADARRERAVARRIRDAHFAENKTLEGFSWEFNPKAFDRVQIEELATGDFIRRHTNLILVGWSGVGKSHIIQALGQKACVHGYRVLYRTSAQLLTDLTASLADKTLPSKLRRYASPICWSSMSSVLTESSVQNVLRRPICSIRSSRPGIGSAPRRWSPMWTSTSGESIYLTAHWLWPFWTDLWSEPSSSRSKASLTAPHRSSLQRTSRPESPSRPCAAA
jgi:IstB-like ATP binding protein